MSKVGLSKTLKALHDRGLLTDALVQAPSAIGYSRQVQRAFEQQALYTQTPYGPMLREMEFPAAHSKAKAKRPSMWYISPFALLHQLCIVSAPLFNLIKNAVGGAGTRVLRIVLYFDGINPGSPLAPHPQQLLQAIYWCIADLPNRFLRRTDSRFCFSLIRETWAKELAGERTELAKLVLGVFFLLSSIRFTQASQFSVARSPW